MRTNCLLPFLTILMAQSLVPAHAADCTSSPETRLTITFERTEQLSMNGPLGQSRLNLLRLRNAASILDSQLPEEWRCLAYDPEGKRYLLGGIWQRGAWRPLASLVYLDEASGILRDSAFSRENYLANALVVSPSGRYVAFIGGQNGVSGSLHLLDTHADHVSLLSGQAPLPPPSRPAHQICRGSPFQWGTCYGDGFVTLDPGILDFSGDQQLIASFGKDLPLRRAKQRHIRRFALPVADRQPPDQQGYKTNGSTT